ncbi:MAG: esterase family protein [Clostridia bacterium]|nr:esterase family protein [Clostridia bacterium]
MITLTLNASSKALGRRVSFNVLLPECKDGSGVPGTPYKTLWLLHGLAGDENSWLMNSSIVRYATEYGIAVVMPNVDRSWYADTAYGAKYFTFLTKELPEICRSAFKGMSEKREDNIVAGLSMGGYGALKAALLCPEMYGYCASLSGSLDITRKNRPYNLDEWKSLFGFDMQSAEELAGGENDLFAKAKRNADDGIPFPKLYLWCGTEDSLIAVNRDFHALLDTLGVEHRYEESEGNHSWRWWDLHIQDALAYLFE